MTLCIAWKDRNGIHLAADSRLTLARDSWADVGIKVLALSYTVVDPYEAGGGGLQKTRYSGELGMCFAGSAVNSLTIKESVAAALGRLQHFPGMTDVSLGGLVAFIFVAYRHISRRVCETAIGKNGLADMVIAGFCQVEQRHRAFRLTTDPVTNVASMEEVLTAEGDNILLGSQSAVAAATQLLDMSLPPLRALRAIIGDGGHPAVGGPLQYGLTTQDGFRISGELAFNDGVHYWRGGIDFNDPEFQVECPFIPSLAYIEPD